MCYLWRSPGSRCTLPPLWSLPQAELQGFFTTSFQWKEWRSICFFWGGWKMLLFLLLLLFCCCCCCCCCCFSSSSCSFCYIVFFYWLGWGWLRQGKHWSFLFPTLRKQKSRKIWPRYLPESITKAPIVSMICPHTPRRDPKLPKPDKEVYYISS